MKKLSISIIGTATILVASASLGAQSLDQNWNQHQGAYVGANAGTNLVYLGVLSSEGSATNEGLYGFGYSVDVGYNFTSHFAVETGFMQNFIDFNQYVNDDDMKDPTLRQHSNIGYGALKMILPIGERASFFGKVGAMYANADHESIVLPYVGAGLAYAVTQNLEVTGQYEGAVYGVAGAGLLSGGLTYHF